MEQDRTGQIAVISTARRTREDADGHARAAAAMDVLAAAQPGCRGVGSARGADGIGITVSWRADAAAAPAWRDHPRHARIRNTSRERWYCGCEVAVAIGGRSDRWQR